MALQSLLSAMLPSAVVGLSVDSAFESVVNVFYLLQWQLPVLPVVCIVLGVLTARKTHRSTFNWVLVGLFAGVIPVVGPVLMVVAYFWYPPPAPTRRAGYHPPGSGAARTKPGSGAARTKRGQRRPRTGSASQPARRRTGDARREGATTPRQDTAADARREGAATPRQEMTGDGPTEGAKVTPAEEADAARRTEADDRP
ncbi:MAG TPA: hypothetical protein PLT83_00680 [Thermoleophilia bacterium]|nr:hypothetical protein [Thermoleophilia bacterium]